MPEFVTFGYSGVCPEWLQKTLLKIDGTLADIRLNPYSRNHEWNLAPLTKRFQERYVWIKDLGNINYKGGPILLRNPEKGFETLLSLPRPVVLMCVCWNSHTCHRNVVAEELRRRGHKVEELIVRKPERRYPEVPAQTNEHNTGDRPLTPPVD